jgi:hypothetical protein
LLHGIRSSSKIGFHSCAPAPFRVAILLPHPQSTRGSLTTTGTVTRWRPCSSKSAASEGDLRRASGVEVPVRPIVLNCIGLWTPGSWAAMSLVRRAAAGRLSCRRDSRPPRASPAPSPRAWHGLCVSVSSWLWARARLRLCLRYLKHNEVTFERGNRQWQTRRRCL